MRFTAKWRRIVTVSIGTLLVSLIGATSVFAYDVPSNNKQILAFLDKFSAVLHPVNFIFYFMRQLGWMLITILGYFVDQLSGTFTKIATMKPFYNSSAVTSMMDGFKPYRGPVLTVVLAGIGLFLILGFRIKGGEALRNITIMALIMLALPFLMSKMYAVAGAYLKDGNTTLQTGSQVILTNISDVYYYAKDDFSHKTPPQTLGPITVNQVDITEIAEPDAVSDLAKKKGKYFNYKKMSEITSKGDYKDVAVKKEGISSWAKPFSSIFGDYYYRYTWHPWVMLFSLVANGLVLLLSMFKIVGISIDLAFNQMFALVVSFFDFKMTKFRKIIEHIFASLATVMVISAMMTLFTLYASFINSQSIGAIGHVIALLAAAYYAINGPDMMVRLFGVDSGVKSGWELMGGALGLKKAAQFGGQMLKKAGNGLSAVAGAVAGAAGLGEKNTSKSGDGLLHGKNGKMNDSSKAPSKESLSEGEAASPIYGNSPSTTDGGNNASDKESGLLHPNDASEQDGKSQGADEKKQQSQDGDKKTPDAKQDDPKISGGEINKPSSPLQKDNSKTKKNGKSSGEKQTGSPIHKETGKGNSATQKPTDPLKQQSKDGKGSNQQTQSPVYQGNQSKSKEGQSGNGSKDFEDNKPLLNPNEPNKAQDLGSSTDAQPSSPLEGSTNGALNGAGAKEAAASSDQGEQSQPSVPNMESPKQQVDGQGTSPINTKGPENEMPHKSEKPSSLKSVGGTNKAQSAPQSVTQSTGSQHSINSGGQTERTASLNGGEIKSAQSASQNVAPSPGITTPRGSSYQSESASSDSSTSGGGNTSSESSGPNVMPYHSQEQGRHTNSGAKSSTAEQKEGPSIGPMNFEPGHASAPLKHPIRDMAKNAINNKIQSSDLAKNYNKGKNLGKQFRDAKAYNDNIKKGRDKR